MKFRAPVYYSDFHCIADKCKNSCCSAGWEIDIDSETEEFYGNVSGDFGDKLRKSISNTKPAHFLLDGKKNCPFLNDKKLCDIFTVLGEEHLCQICKDHPRFYEWFDGVKEAGIGLCCEEAARIILSNKSPFNTYEVDIDNEDFDKYDTTVYNYLSECRKKIIEYMDNCSSNCMKKIKNVLWFGNMVQLDLDSGLLDDEDIIDVGLPDNINNFGQTNNELSYEMIIEFLCGLEPNSKDWIPYLEKCLNVYNNSEKHLEEFENKFTEVNMYLKNIAIYFVWRYFLKSVFDGDVIGKLKLMCISVLIIRWLMYCHYLEFGTISLSNCVDIVRRYSEEIEYSDENLDKFFTEFYNGDIFDVEKLINIK